MLIVFPCGSIQLYYSGQNEYAPFFLRACFPNKVIITGSPGSFLCVQFWNQVKITRTGFFLGVFFELGKIPEIACFVDTGSGAVVHVRNHAYPIKKMSTIVVFQISDMYSENILRVRSFLQTRPKKKWQGSSW